MRQLHVFTMSRGSLQTVIKLNVMAAAVWWCEEVKKSFDTNLHIMYSNVSHAVDVEDMRPPNTSTDV